MILYLSTGARLEIQNDKPIGIGFITQKPTKKLWLESKKEVESLLGYMIVEWGAFVNPSTKMFWTEIGDSRTCSSGSPRLETYLEQD
jgi:hypothetical protein